MTDDIITQLLPFIHDEMRMPAGLIKTVIEEIEQLREKVEDCEQDFHALKQMFDAMRESRNEWRNVAEQLRHGPWHDAKQLYEQTVSRFGPA